MCLRAGAHWGELSPPKGTMANLDVFVPSPQTLLSILIVKVIAYGIRSVTQQECKTLPHLYACVWSLGGGVGGLTHPCVLDSGSSLGVFSNRQWPQSRTAGSYVLTATFNGPGWGNGHSLEYPHEKLLGRHQG